MTERMKAWQLAAPGDVLEQLSLNTEAPRPSPQSLKSKEILVKVISAGINPADYKVPGLGFIARSIVSFPNTIGMDLSGEVVAVAAGVTDVLVGDYVIGHLDAVKRPGALSEYVVLPFQGYAKLSRDANLDFAGPAGTAALTAYQTIKPYVKPGDRVFINGGSGGTGTYGLQIAKLLGCQVTTSCSTAKVELCKDLGADKIIDYKKSSIVEELKKDGPVYSLVVDNVGRTVPELYGNASGYLLPEGRYIVVGAETATQMASLVTTLMRPSFLGGGKHKISPYVTQDSHDDLSQLADWFSEGKLKTAIDSTYEFDDALEAYKTLKKGSAAGKIVIHVSPRK
ncbi:hypothetical protein K4F52_005251 [Lecanicillium sp. MT-2017a]|nr:hypothetical protein K4F52_005251 [Lecanicillium sp. MT-2017a]